MSKVNVRCVNTRLSITIPLLFSHWLIGSVLHDSQCHLLSSLSVSATYSVTPRHNSLTRSHLKSPRPMRCFFSCSSGGRGLSVRHVTPAYDFSFISVPQLLLHRCFKSVLVNCCPYIPSSQSSFKRPATAIIPSALFNVCLCVCVWKRKIDTQKTRESVCLFV